jgi:hypothetical protein
MTASKFIHQLALSVALEEVEKAVAAAKEEIGRPEPGAGHDRAWFDRHRAVMTRVAADLTERLGARITDRWDGAKVKIAGVSSTCTGGLGGALSNWVTAARRKLAQ